MCESYAIPAIDTLAAALATTAIAYERGSDRCGGDDGPCSSNVILPSAAVIAGISALSAIWGYSSVARCRRQLRVTSAEGSARGRVG